MGQAPDEAERMAAATERIAAAQREADSALSLADLGLTRLPESLRTLKYLTQLDLSGNQLAELPGWLGELAALEGLVLRGNRLTHLPSSLAGLSRLTQLDAADNRLLQVAPELAAMPRLAAIELRGNPHLLVPPPEIVAQDSHAVLNYLRGLGGGGLESAPTEALVPSIWPSTTPPRTDKERGSWRKVVMIGIPVLVICAAVAITAAFNDRQPSVTPPASLPVAPAAASIGTAASSPTQATAKVAKTSHATTASPSPTSVTGHASTHAAPSAAGATSTTAPASSAATAAAATYPTAAPGVDLAADNPVAASSTMENYTAANTVDGNPNTYWESLDGASFPQTLTVDLGEVTTVGRFDFQLPQQSDWNERTETFTILGSTNGSDFFTIEPSATYTFNANSSSDDSASLSIGPVHARYVELYFTATDGWPAAQMGELGVYS
jgi:cytoskeletal protein RodZ